MTAMDNTAKLIFSTHIDVRWGDMDAYSHVNNAMYMRYLEEARVQLLAEMGASMDGNGIDPVIINVGCTFLQPVTYPERLRIDCYVGAPGRSSFMSWYRIYPESAPDQLASEGYAKVVWMDHRSGRSTPLPEKIRRRLPSAG
ncbi:acyl-CoA thioesterase [Marinobacterium jannaschii]|uniref:acyl-CoA thioesterase n=1 Tax=Marinobacterium jannaschii TaxID=64970 RepID=UPI000AE0A95D|nr:thioesterase family protein [Marinobacterium jannaschii]